MDVTVQRLSQPNQYPPFKSNFDLNANESETEMKLSKMKIHPLIDWKFQFE